MLWEWVYLLSGTGKYLLERIGDKYIGVNEGYILRIYNIYYRVEYKKYL